MSLRDLVIGSLQRFDADGGGLLDGDQWAVAQRAAPVEVRRRQRERFGGANMDLIARPADGWNLVISAVDRATLARRARRRASLAFLRFVVTASLIFRALSTPLTAAGVEL